MIEMHNLCFYCTLEHFYATRAATAIYFCKLDVNLQNIKDFSFSIPTWKEGDAENARLLTYNRRKDLNTNKVVILAEMSYIADL